VVALALPARLGLHGPVELRPTFCSKALECRNCRPLGLLAASRLPLVLGVPECRALECQELALLVSAAPALV
jgi:hypothetical protein